MIDTLEECKGAVSNLGFSFLAAESEENYPKGCYRQVVNGHPVWNTHENGTASDQAEVICKSGEWFKNHCQFTMFITIIRNIVLC